MLSHSSSVNCNVNSQNVLEPATVNGTGVTPDSYQVQVIQYCIGNKNTIEAVLSSQIVFADLNQAKPQSTEQCGDSFLLSCLNLVLLLLEKKYYHCESSLPTRWRFLELRVNIDHYR